MPSAVALLNYITSDLLWRIFCQTGTFLGVFSPYIINNAIRISAAAIGRGGGHYINTKEENKKGRTSGHTGIYMNFDPNWSKKRKNKKTKNRTNEKKIRRDKKRRIRREE